MTSLLTTLVLATEGAEGLSGDHIASKLAVPLGIVIFCGGVFALLWSNYGAKKGALIYGTAAGGFCMVIGVFWWFGAPGTPVATGPQNFPGQDGAHYQAQWFPFEPGSETAGFFSSANDLGGFVPLADFLGKGDASEEALGDDPRYTNLNGDVAQADQLMVNLALKVDADGEVRLGGETRGEYQDAGEAGLADEVDDPENYSRAEPFFTAEAAEERLVTESNGTFLAGTEVTIETNYVNEAGETVTIDVDAVPMFAFKEPSALWFPSAVWTFTAAAIFGLCLFSLDRIEQREKKRAQEVREPEDLAVSIRQ